MFCSKCGAQLDEGSAFCPRCGVARAPIVAEVAVDVSPKSRLATSLLGIFVGEFGVHRLYAGRVRTGVLMLVTGVLAVGVLFLGPYALTKETGDDVATAIFIGVIVLGLLPFAVVRLWSFIDAFLAMTGNFKDSQGKPIKKW